MNIDSGFPREYGGYLLTGFLGAGGSAEVYRAEPPGTGKAVAIRRIARKVDSDRSVQSMLLEEARAWVSLRHANIVSVIDIGQHDGDWFLVLELVEGATAAEVLHAEGPLPPDQALCITERLAEALGYAHSLTILGKRVEVVHRDVKPANILLASDGRVKLTDFGIARTNDRLGTTKAGFVKGSLHYLAPEQVRRETLDGRTDLFALGCTLHMLLTCTPLIDLEKDEVFRRLQTGAIPRPPTHLPSDLRELLADLTAADPARRPASGEIVAERVRAMLEPQTAEELQPLIAERVLATRGRLADDSATSQLTNDAPLGSIVTSIRKMPTLE